MKFADLNVDEALNYRHAPKGTVPFRKIIETDPEIQKIIRDVAAKTGVGIPEILQQIKPTIEEIHDLKKYSPFLYDTMAQNVVETAAFDLIWKSDVLTDKDLESVKFDDTLFSRLVKQIQYENYDAFFRKGLRAPRPAGQMPKPIYEIKSIIVPSPYKQYAQFNDVDTAAADANGNFIFNRDFMQKLLYWGSAVNVQPSGKKYQCNGGEFPNGYAYIEFLIMHELLHYACGDFEVGAFYKNYSHTVHNWASDFRSNYMLVKSGYEQLPLGLFSDDLNYDRFDTYKALVAKVDEELKKLPKPPSQQGHDQHKQKDQGPWKPKAGDIFRRKDGTYGRVTRVDPDGTFDGVTITEAEAMAAQGNNAKGLVGLVNRSLNGLLESIMMIMEGSMHPDDVTWIQTSDGQGGGGGGAGPKNAEQQPGQEKQPGQGQDQEPGQEKQPGGGAGGTGQEKQPGAGGNQDTDMPWDPDQILKDIEERLSQRKDETEAEASAKGRPQGPRADAGQVKRQSVFTKTDKVAVPRFNWHQIMAQFVSSMSPPEPSRSKPDPRGVTQTHIAGQIGAAAVKPGERTSEEAFKLVLVFDTSGSMQQAVPIALAEARSLITRAHEDLDPNLAVVFYADSPRYIAANYATNQCWEIPNLMMLDKPAPGKKHTLNDIFSLMMTGGTTITPGMMQGLSALASKGYNVMFFTDADITWDRNWELFLAFYKAHRQNTFLLAAGNAEYNAIIKKLGGIQPPNWGQIG